MSDRSAGGVVVAGAAGVGKTRLAGEVSQAAESRGCAVAWVRATRSAASIPLGAFAALMPASGESGGVELLARARDALVERGGGRRLVLCVDDGQLLDEASAALTHQLVAAGEAFAVVTVRRGERVPDALRALWKDELCTLVELDELSRAEAEQLLGAALGGPVDGRSASALWELALGNALFLRELVLYGIERGVLDESDGIWRWRGEVAAGTRLAELVEARLEVLEAGERGVLEVVAVGAPLDAELLEPAEIDALASLEAHGVVEHRVEGRRRTVDVAHPLHGEVVRAQLPRTRSEGIQRRLGDAVAAHGARRRDDLLRLAAWRLESGGAVDVDLFQHAAGKALAALDSGLAERFARAAVQAGGGFGARLALGRALAGAGHAVEAEALLRELAAEAGDDGQRAAVAIASARNLFWALDRAGDADAVLRSAEGAVSDERRRQELVGLRVRLESARGRPQEALATAQPLLRDPGVPAQAQLNAAIGAAEALLTSGRIAETLELIDTWLPVASRHAEELPVAGPVLISVRGFALRFAGRLLEATEVAEHSYDAAIAQRSAQTTAVEAAQLGYIWLARGRVRTALRFFSEGASLLRDVDSVGMLSWALAGVGQAAAQAGELELAREAVAEMDRTPLGHKSFECDLGLARAWSAAAAGELSRARALALEAAALVQARGQYAIAARALHELCRLGDPGTAAPALAGLVARVEGPFTATAAAHAAALGAHDGRALQEAAQRFAAQGALLAAAEAAAAAAAAYHDAGRAASARSAAARSAAWLHECEGARPPTLLGARTADELTSREREIAMLAASGLSSREIADRLVVSVRTVDNHLQRAYRKLGISRRQELGEVLAGTPE